MKFVENGQFSCYVEKTLAHKDYYKAYRAGQLDPPQFCEAMFADSALADVPGFHEWNIRRIALTPWDETLPAKKLIGRLIDHHLLPKHENMYEGFDAFRKTVREGYDHGEFFTCVFPEDERLLYALAELKKPRRTFVAGAYYGFLVIWAMRSIAACGGTIVLSDIDAEVCALAEQNFRRFGYGNITEVVCADAVELLRARSEPIDMLVLDATGLHDDPRPEMRGKRIYGSLFKAAKRLLAKDALIVIHNMEPEHPDMRELVEELRGIRAIGTNYDTYNGLGAYIPDNK